MQRSVGWSLVPRVAVGVACVVLAGSPSGAAARDDRPQAMGAVMELAGPCCSPSGGSSISVEEGWLERPVRHRKEHARADLVVTLDQQLFAALAPVVREFASRNHVKIALENGTCGISAGALYRKEADVGGFCCPPGAGDRLPGLRYHTLGIAAVAPIVHPSNPLTTINLAAARRVFTGELQHWRELLPPGVAFPHAIQPVTRLHCKQRPGHWRLILDNENLFAPRVIDVGAIADMIGSVARSPATIGYETVWMVERHRDIGAVKVLLLDGESAYDRRAIAAGRYPFYRAFQVTTWAGAAANPLADRLVQVMDEAFATAPAKFEFVSRALLEQHGWQFTDGELQGEPAQRP